MIRRKMMLTRSILLAAILLSGYPAAVFADSTLPVDPTPIAASPAALIIGFPWGLVAVFIVVGFIMTYIKKNNPNKVTSNTCLPLIDEDQQAREKARIAREEAEK
jgi:hypothetical protein